MVVNIAKHTYLSNINTSVGLAGGVLITQFGNCLNRT